VGPGALLTRKVTSEPLDYQELLVMPGSSPR